MATRPSQLRRFARRRAAAQEGMVLLIVVFVLSIATALASASLKLGRSALHEAGDYRTAVQSRYLAEAVLQQGIALTESATTWRSTIDPPGTLRMFQRYGMRDMDAIHETRHISGTNMAAGVNAAERPIFELPAAANGMVGTLGTNVTYSPTNAVAAGRDDMVMHVFDCRLYSAGSPGADATAAAGSVATTSTRRSLCQVEAHARLEVVGSGTRTWTVPGQTGVYTQVMAGVQRTAVGTIVMETSQ